MHREDAKLHTDSKPSSGLTQGIWSCEATMIFTVCRTLLQNIQYKYRDSSCIPPGLPEGLGSPKQVEYHLWLETALLFTASHSQTPSLISFLGSAAVQRNTHSPKRSAYTVHVHKNSPIKRNLLDRHYLFSEEQEERGRRSMAHWNLITSLSARPLLPGRNPSAHYGGLRRH